MKVLSLTLKVCRHTIRKSSSLRFDGLQPSKLSGDLTPVSDTIFYVLFRTVFPKVPIREMPLSFLAEMRFTQILSLVKEVFYILQFSEPFKEHNPGVQLAGSLRFSSW